MYKKEIKIPSQYINNFYDGSIYDLVFLDLEWCRDFQKNGTVQKIFGYTLTRILEDSNEQYIKIQFIGVKGGAYQFKWGYVNVPALNYLSQMVTDQTKNYVYYSFSKKDVVENESATRSK